MPWRRTIWPGVQGVKLLAHSCVSAGGIIVGCLSACGAREKKT